MAEFIISLTIYGLVSLLMIVIGIVQYRSKKPVGFYTGEKPPKAENITDVTAWNHGHGMLFICYGMSLMLSYLSHLFLSELASTCIMLLVAIGGIVLMCICHSKLQAKYLKRK